MPGPAQVPPLKPWVILAWAEARVEVLMTRSLFVRSSLPEPVVVRLATASALGRPAWARAVALLTTSAPAPSALGWAATRVPASTVVTPLYVLAPERVIVPAPDLVKP